MIHLGIDESNHGRIPEFFVTVRSSNPLLLDEGKYGKLEKRGTFHLTVDALETRLKTNLRGIDWRFMVFDQEEAEELRRSNLMWVAAAEAARTYGDESKLMAFYLDGKLPTQKRDALRRYLRSEGVIPHIHNGKSYDQRYGIVNVADAFARFLRGEYSQKGEDAMEPFQHARLRPHIEGYVALLDDYELRGKRTHRRSRRR